MPFMLTPLAMVFRRTRIPPKVSQQARQYARKKTPQKSNQEDESIREYESRYMADESTSKKDILRTSRRRRYSIFDNRKDNLRFSSIGFRRIQRRQPSALYFPVVSSRRMVNMDPKIAFLAHREYSSAKYATRRARACRKNYHHGWQSRLCVTVVWKTLCGHITSRILANNIIIRACNHWEKMKKKLNKIDEKKQLTPWAP